jgi:hypothetical protein
MVYLTTLTVAYITGLSWWITGWLVNSDVESMQKEVAVE